MNKPLYCYSFNEETCKIVKTEITDYEEGIWSNRQKYYRYKKCGNTYYSYGSDLDRLKHWKLYTFTLTDDEAREIIIEEIYSRWYKYNAQAVRYKNILEKVNAQQVEKEK